MNCSLDIQRTVLTKLNETFFSGNREGLYVHELAKETGLKASLVHSALYELQHLQHIFKRFGVDQWCIAYAGIEALKRGHYEDQVELSDDLYAELGAAIRTARQNAKLTQKALGSKVKLGQRTISQYENGKIHPDKPRLVHLALALQLPEDTFVRMLDKREQAS